MADAPVMRTHSLRQTYGGGPVPMWECRGCGERWWTEHHDQADLERQPCGTREEQQ